MTEREARARFCEKHPFLEVLRQHNVSLIGDGNQRKAKCPFHKDKNPSFSVNISDGSWNCFAGCGSGGVVELVAKFDNKDPESMLVEFAAMEGGDKTNGHVEKYVDWKKCVEDFTDEDKANLAKWRGYRPEFVDLMVEHQMVGRCDGNLSFPIYAAGRVTGTHQKIKGGSWITRGGTDKPWIIGGDHFETVLIFESQWDAFAFMDATRWLEMNMASISSIVITRGANKAKGVKNMFPIKGSIIAWMQNDPESDDGSSPAKSWLNDLVKTIGSVHACWPPKEHKDLNDWLRAGAVSAEILELAQSAPKYRDPSLPAIKPHLDFRKMMRFDPNNDDSCLIGQRYLCKGGSCIWVGASGLGKSVLNLQAAIIFALNQSLFGLETKKPLKSVILSAEDDEGDLAETLKGVTKAMGIDENDTRFEVMQNSVFLYQESEHRGLKLVGYAEELVREHKADFVWINPVLSYFTGNPNDAKDVGEFCGALSGMQFNTGVCTHLIHHTGKPKEADTTKHWSLDDFSYIGLGSSVWTNWARAIVVLQGLKNPSGTFVLRFAKRGNRTGIVDDDFNKVREVYLEHSQTGLCWVPSDYKPPEKDGGGRPQKAKWNLIENQWSGEPLSNEAWTKLCREVLSVSDKTARRVMSKWSGIHIIKNTNDLWVKCRANGQNGQNPV